MDKGRFTLPGEKGMEKEIKNLVELWGVDAVRDSDGTELSQEIVDMDLQIYSTLCLIREDNAWSISHPEYRQQVYLMTDEKTAVSTVLSIFPMEHYFAEQFVPNTDVDITRFWQVMDRTTGQIVTNWTFQDEHIIIEEAIPFHRYTLAFLAYQIWEPVSMYNHITNGWNEEHRVPLDVRYPQARAHILEVLQNWIACHKETDVVRFTTFFYNFDLFYNNNGKEKQVNWFGYSNCVSPYAMELFEQEYGYELTAEDFVDEGRYHTLFKNPTQKYRDWMDFNQKFVASFARECVEEVHKVGKKAIMFLGDHWAGTEPYGTYFPTIGLDAVVGAAGDGVTTRMIADIPVKETEARFYPYFFPDVFCVGGKPVEESSKIWIACRRALLQRPMSRMGYGGYLSLALQFPDFVTHVTQIAEQFRLIHQESAGELPKQASFQVAILNSWGKLRSWQTHQVAHSLWNQRCYSYLGILEALAGFPVTVQFISFEEIKKEGIPKEIGVIINAGDAGTSWSGDTYWKDEKVTTTIRKWVHEGGGFVGVGEPSAYEHAGKLFQLEDVLGVQKECGYTASTNKPKWQKQKHFITEEIAGDIDYGEGMNMIYCKEQDVAVLDGERGNCLLTAHAYGKGRAVYITGLPYNPDNARLLLRTLYWTAGKEAEWQECRSSNKLVECNYYDKQNKICLINNSEEEQETTVMISNKELGSFNLYPMEMRWLNLALMDEKNEINHELL